MRAVAVFEFDLGDDLSPADFHAAVETTGTVLVDQIPSVPIRTFVAINEVADDVISLVEGGNHEWQCPNCGAVTRALMAF